MRIWNQVLQWALDSLFPWFEEKLPIFAPIVRQTFATLDGIIMSPNQWVRQITFNKAQKVVIEEEIDFYDHDLPDEVREAFIQREEKD
ncbi:hypothetical protein [Planktothrix pseudagardhii]|uniref:Uncharacterized protein n=1 Tax=Planktothrix pseudagardhii TaxID=132604 RepID=A0A9W4CTY5_9CYAN|nr:hypothetical protein [Planktothrix pseudagardhii]CAD5972274.1 hypothetical protein NO713_03903 [Planktothrix pseudagardhii]